MLKRIMRRMRRYKWSIAVCAAALLFAVPALSGCGGGKDVRASQEQGSEAKGRKESSDTEETERGEEDTSNTSNVGQSESGGSEEVSLGGFAATLMKAVEAKDLDALIKCSGFPVTISSVKTNGGVIEGVEEFGEVDPELIFTEDFVKSITNFDLKRIVKGESGFVVGDEKNSIVFDEKDGTFAITAIHVK